MVDAVAAAARSRVADFVALTKPRIAVASAFAAGAGWAAAGGGGRLLPALAGTLLAAGSAAALNMWLERDVDAVMARTRTRPIPAGRVTGREALAFGFLLAALAGAVLASAGPLPSLLAAGAWAAYLLVYTPLKRVTALALVPGAVAGAAPPVVGWSAARGGLEGGAWALFGLVFAWQIPHFLALAWRCRADYAAAGLPLAPAGAPWLALPWTAAMALAGVAAAPGPMSAALGAGALACGVAWAARPEARTARLSFVALLAYLPLQLALAAVS